MADHGNIIDIVQRLKDRASNGTETKVTADPILEKLKQVRFRHEFCRHFARNLGDMAAELDPAEPMRAAREMFDEAFGPTAGDNWRKRKRYLRFQGEETPFRRAGDYVASFGPYLKLASIYAKRQFPHDKDGPKKANRLLIKGTTLLPTVDVSKIDGLTQAIDCLKHVQEKCVADTEIVEAYSYLNRFPIAPFSDAVCPGHLTVNTRRTGLAIVAVPTSTILEFNKVLEDRINNNIFDLLRPWYVGRLLLGYAYFPRVTSRLMLSLSPDEFLERSANLRDYGNPTLEFVNGLITEALREQDIVGFWPGDEYFNGTPIPDRLNYTIHIRKTVYLSFTHNGKEMELSITLGGEEIEWTDINFSNPEVYRCGSSPDEDEILMPGGDNTFRGISSWLFYDSAEIDDWGFRVVSSEGKVCVIGGPPYQEYDIDYCNAAIFDDRIREILAHGGSTSSTFKSVIWDDLTQLSAAPHGSVAATILRNWARAPEESRLDTLLLKDLRERLEGIVDFVRQKLGKTADVLRERGLEP